MAGAAVVVVTGACVVVVDVVVGSAAVVVLDVVVNVVIVFVVVGSTRGVVVVSGSELVVAGTGVDVVVIGAWVVGLVEVVVISKGTVSNPPDPLHAPNRSAKMMSIRFMARVSPYGEQSLRRVSRSFARAFGTVMAELPDASDGLHTVT